MSKSHDIVYIDDEPEGVLAEARALRAAPRFKDYAPPVPDAAAAVAAESNLWVFDFFNDDSQRQNPDLAGVSSNGLGVFQQFRLLVGDARPPAVLVSNHLDEALGCDVHPSRRHILAEQAGVEWVSPKVDGKHKPIKEILSLADGVATLRALSDRLTASDASRYAAELAMSALKLPKNASWKQTAARGVAEWRPPVWVETRPPHKAVGPRRGHQTYPELRSARDVIAWMLRQVLPYPSFLVRAPHVALRLGITMKCLSAALRAETALAKQVRRLAYTGILDDFDGPRWWSAGVDALAWDLQREGVDRKATLAKLLAPVQLRELKLIDPVVVSDADLVETDDIAPVAECVRATDEYFPSQATPAWVRIIDARGDVALARKVRLEDQPDLLEAP